MINEIYDYIDAGFRVFGIHGADKKGRCGCGDTECKALYKHPVLSNWQKVPHWSDEQIETFDQLGHFDTGFGVLCSGWLLIDIDARNGGVDSFKKLLESAPAAGQSKFVVNTGSGNGSQHHYFKLPEPMALMQSHPDYPGIDFKTSGYVIGAGSLHASGARYEVVSGFPQDVGDAPHELIELLRRPAYYRANTDRGEIDVTKNDVAELLSYISSDCGYDQWIRIGMAIHHTLRGDGFDVWDSWSANGSTYPGAANLERHWHSFGKSASPAGYGTLLHYAREGGYCEPVTFVYDGPGIDDAITLDTTGIDLKRPPGFVGELCAWINDQCLYPRENLSVAASLCAVSSLAGMRVIDGQDGMTGNMIAFCVAGSSTGKESVQQAYLKIMKTAGVQAAVYGGFKSEQEVMRNLIRHQGAFYSVDELGLVLRKLDNASKRGGAAYLEGIVGLIMSVYSKADGYLPITGDLKEEIREKLRTELARTEKRIDDLPSDSSSDSLRGKLERAAEQIRNAMRTIDDGLTNPYLTLIGYATPVTFNDLMTFEQATNGLMARALLFSDLETNPKRKKLFSKRDMPDGMIGAIQNLYSPGKFDLSESDQRIEHTGDKTVIPSTPEAVALLDDVYEHFYQLAETHKSASGMEAIPRRGYELAAKISLVLAMPEGIRTHEHVLWAFALAKRDVDHKIKTAYSTDNKKDANGLAAKILSLVTIDHGETAGVICNRLRGTPKEQVLTLLKKMVDEKMLVAVESKHTTNNKTFTTFYAAE